MSEPVSTAEIEDVLSSIRRLVSNDVEAAQESAAPALKDEAPAGKLILTADFRVSTSQDAAPDEGDSETPEVTAESEAETDPEVAEDAPIEFNHAQDHVQSVEADADFEAHVDAQINSDTPPEANTASAQPVEDAKDVDVEGNASVLENTIAELEAAIGQQDGDWEPDGSDFEEDAEAEEVMSEPVQDWIDGTAQEVPIEATDTPIDPVAEAADDTAAKEPSSDLFGSVESVIDEDALRDMVSDIVRQELQGALGERITRNVRKLVRREINRVLASQEFE